MKATGKMISNTVVARRHGLMAQCLKAISLKVLSMVEESLASPTAAIIRENLSITTSRGSASTSGLMVESMMDSGKTTRCMAKEF